MNELDILRGLTVGIQKVECTGGAFGVTGDFRWTPIVTPEKSKSLTLGMLAQLWNFYKTILFKSRIQKSCIYEL